MLGRSYTPRFAKIVSWKYSQMSERRVVEDMQEHHRRPMSRALVKRVSAVVAEIAQQREFEWSYDLPEFEEVISHISISRDGTTTPIRSEGYRETMCGTISFYTKQGDRLHTIYTACAPEELKVSFNAVMSNEISDVKEHFPDVSYLGVADGARENWLYLESHISVSILDYYHATEYLRDASEVVFNTRREQSMWYHSACSTLKNKPRGARSLLKQLKEFESTHDRDQVPKALHRAITYFEYNSTRMRYADYQKKGYPIGSGVTEAACKTVAKQRLNQSGMRWSLAATQHILLLRGLICTHGRWNQFWNHIVRDQSVVYI